MTEYSLGIQPSDIVACDLPLNDYVPPNALVHKSLLFLSVVPVNEDANPKYIIHVELPCNLVGDLMQCLAMCHTYQAMCLGFIPVPKDMVNDTNSTGVHISDPLTAAIFTALQNALPYYDVPFDAADPGCRYEFAGGMVRFHRGPDTIEAHVVEKREYVNPSCSHSYFSIDYIPEKGLFVSERLKTGISAGQIVACYGDCMSLLIKPVMGPDNKVSHTENHFSATVCAKAKLVGSIVVMDSDASLRLRDDTKVGYAMRMRSVIFNNGYGGSEQGNVSPGMAKPIEDENEVYYCPDPDSVQTTVLLDSGRSRVFKSAHLVLDAGGVPCHLADLNSSTIVKTVCDNRRNCVFIKRAKLCPIENRNNMLPTLLPVPILSAKEGKRYFITMFCVEFDVCAVVNYCPVAPGMPLWGMNGLHYKHTMETKDMCPPAQVNILKAMIVNTTDEDRSMMVNHLIGVCYTVLGTCYVTLGDLSNMCEYELLTALSCLTYDHHVVVCHHVINLLCYGAVLVLKGLDASYNGKLVYISEEVRIGMLAQSRLDWEYTDTVEVITSEGRESLIVTFEQLRPHSDSLFVPSVLNFRVTSTSTKIV